jgi:hypothetical protein
MAYNTMMKAKKLLDSKHAFDDGAIQQLVIWNLPKPVFGSQHHYKYSLYYGKNGERIVGYDNERGKGDHKHIHGQEYPYTFSGLDVLVRDFLDDVKRAKHER